MSLSEYTWLRIALLLADTAVTGVDAVASVLNQSTDALLSSWTHSTRASPLSNGPSNSSLDSWSTTISVTQRTLPEAMEPTSSEYGSSSYAERLLTHSSTSSIDTVDVSISTIQPASPDDNDDNDDNDDAQRCQSMWASYEMSLSSLARTNRYHTQWIAQTPSMETEAYSVLITLGTASPYTTIDGYPHVKGTFTITDVITSTLFSTISHKASNRSTLVPIHATPQCTIPEPQCSFLWQSFLGSIGLPTTDLAASFPFKYERASNLPRCSLTDSSEVCHTEAVEAYSFKICGVNARVSLFYWPPLETVQAPFEHGLVTALVDGHMFTSPTAYILFPEFSASIIQPIIKSCETRYQMNKLFTWAGHTMMTAFSKPHRSLVGVRIVDLSTYIVAPQEGASRFISSRARSGIQRMEDLDLDARPINISALGQAPGPSPYYLNPDPAYLGEAPYCSSCSYIFDDLYEPMLKLPSDVKDAFGPELEDCEWFGSLHDPPFVLSEALSAQSATFSSIRGAVMARPTPIVTSIPSLGPSPGSKSESPAAATTISDGNVEQIQAPTSPLKIPLDPLGQPMVPPPASPKPSIASPGEDDEISIIPDSDAPLIDYSIISSTIPSFLPTRDLLSANPSPNTVIINGETLPAGNRTIGDVTVTADPGVIPSMITTTTMATGRMVLDDSVLTDFETVSGTRDGARDGLTGMLDATGTRFGSGGMESVHVLSWRAVWCGVLVGMGVMVF